MNMMKVCLANTYSSRHTHYHNIQTKQKNMPDIALSIIDGISGKSANRFRLFLIWMDPGCGPLRVPICWLGSRVHTLNTHKSTNKLKCSAHLQVIVQPEPCFGVWDLFGLQRIPNPQRIPSSPRIRRQSLREHGNGMFPGVNLVVTSRYRLPYICIIFDWLTNWLTHLLTHLYSSFVTHLFTSCDPFFVRSW